MNYYYLILLFACNFLQVFNAPRVTDSPRKENSLVLVHVLFRHGNRTPNGPEELYPLDPYLHEKYFPFGLGQLTNAGKLKEYHIGEVLRDRYNDFLGPYYYPELVEPRSTDYNRTKMSLELVLASCFPPRGVEIWKANLNWQPIPFNYFSRPEDHVLLGVLCPNYVKLYNEYSQSPKVQARFKRYENTFKYISTNSGLNVTSFSDLYYLQFGLRAEEDWGMKLPKWTDKVWPQKMTNLAIKQYSIGMGTTELRQMASGYLVQKIINDTFLRINGNNTERKLYLYSAHEDNIANLLILLDVFEPPHIPNYGSFVIFEVHRINGKYGIKIYYENYTENKPKLLKLPACETFCPINEFISLTEEYIPTSNLCDQ